jgi:hypothetical protein
MTHTVRSPKGATLFSLLCAGLLACALSACGGGDATSAAAKSDRTLASTTVVQADYSTPVQQLYVAYFGRPADGGGLANFEARLAALGAPTDIQALDSAYHNSPQIQSLVDSFGISDESKALYSGDTTAFVNAIYTNVLNRAPDDDGRNYWVNAIDHNGLQRGNAALSIMAGALANKTAQGLVDAAVINNKIAVAGTFTSAIPLDTYSGNAAAALARSMLNSITGSTNLAAFQSTITSTIQAIAAGVKQSIYAGAYSGTYGGYDSGSFTFRVGTDGSISGSGQSNGLGSTLIIAGTLGTNNSSPLPLQGTIGPFTFTATIDASGTLVGNWGGSGVGGFLNAQRVGP